MPFTSKSGIVVADIKNDYLFGLVSHLKQVTSFSDAYIENKIRGAEDDFERDLNILLNTKIIKCEPAPGDTAFDIKEPAYDYESDFFAGERWGWLRLRRYPVQSIQSVVLAYPSLDHTVFTVPASWVKLDGPFGLIRLVPDQAAIYASFTGFIFSLIAGGRALPQSLFVNYTAGFKDAAELKANNQDILEHLKKVMVLDIATDAMTPGSFSTSTDGITQSVSVAVKDYRAEVEAKRRQLRDKIKGVRLAVL